MGGWAIHESGIRSVEVYVDRRYLLSGNTGLNRPDVAQAFPAFKKEMISGWNALLDTTQVPPGPHELVARARAKDGAARDFSVHFVIANPK
jgi:N-acetylmuramoyl-L-alanine amidase